MNGFHSIFSSGLSPLFRRGGLLLVLFAGSVCFAQSAAPVPLHKPTPGRYAGAETCARCHEASSFSMDRTGHAKVQHDGITGCEICHGPGAAHAAAHGDKTQIFAFDAEKESSRERCVSCHTNAHPDMRPTHRELNCLGCHSIHRSKEAPQLRLTRGRLCRSCH